MPEWYSEDVFTEITEAAKFYLDTLAYTPILNKLNGGPIVRKFVENMNNSNLSPNHRKLYLYSGHDKTLFFFAKAHGLALQTIPDYGSTIIFEQLSDEKNKHYIKVRK